MRAPAVVPLLRSLPSELDAEAINMARQWRQLKYFAQKLEPRGELGAWQVSRAHGPPQPRNSARQDQPRSQARADFGTVVGVEKSAGQRQPRPGGNAANDILEKDEQVVGVAFVRRERDVVRDLEVDQSRAILRLIVQKIAGMRIAVGPATAEHSALRGVGPAQFASRRRRHFPREHSAIQEMGEADAGQLLRRHTADADRERSIAVAVQTQEALDLPSLPRRGIGERLHVGAGEPEKSVRAREREARGWPPALDPEAMTVAGFARERVHPDALGKAGSDCKQRTHGAGK